MSENYREKILTDVSKFQEEFVTKKCIRIAGLSNINQNLKNHFIIYEILNLKNGKYYIGQHETKNPLDNYMGSGHFLAKAKQKYGIKCFVKIILYDFDNYEEMNKMEYNYEEMNKMEYKMISLNDCYPYNKMSYNLMEGSHNGRLSQASIDKANRTKQLRGGFSGSKNSMYGQKMRDHMTEEAYNEMKRKQIEHNKLSQVMHELFNDKERYEKWRKKIFDGSKGKILSEEHKKAVGEGIKKLHLHWWNNGSVEIKCKECPEGFNPGRIKRIWWNNGNIEILCSNCPDGFRRGRLKRKK